MSPFNRLFVAPGSLAFGLSLAGCGGVEPVGTDARNLEIQPGSQSTDQIELLRPKGELLERNARPTQGLGVESQIARQLQQLRALKLVEVGAVVRHAQVESCVAYGGCQVTDVDLSAAEVEARVTNFVTTAARVSTASEVPAELCEDGFSVNETALATTLDALRGLQVLEIGDLVRADPTHDGSCYIGFCPSNAADCATANKVQAIARETGAIE